MIDDDDEAAELREEQEARKWMRQQVSGRITEKAPKAETIAKAYNKLEARVRQLEAVQASQAQQITQLMAVVDTLIAEREGMRPTE